MSDLFAEDEEEQRVDHNGKVTEAKKYDTVIKSGQATLKALLILNGGAAIAFLAFMQNILQKPVVNLHAGAFLSMLCSCLFGERSVLFCRLARYSLQIA